MKKLTVTTSLTAKHIIERIESKSMNGCDDYHEHCMHIMNSFRTLGYTKKDEFNLMELKDILQIVHNFAPKLLTNY